MLGGYNDTFVKQFSNFSFDKQWVTAVEYLTFGA